MILPVSEELYLAAWSFHADHVHIPVSISQIIGARLPHQRGMCLYHCHGFDRVWYVQIAGFILSSSVRMLVLSKRHASVSTMTLILSYWMVLAFSLIKHSTRRSYLQLRIRMRYVISVYKNSVVISSEFRSVVVQVSVALSKPMESVTRAVAVKVLVRLAARDTSIIFALVICSKVKRE